MTDTKLNAIHQPFGPAFVGGEAGYASKGAYIGGPHPTWKALLKPAAAGGNYTITAACTGCTEDGSFSKVNISDVTFGDVWHCSGQVKEPPHTRQPTPVDASSQRRRPAAPACPPLSVPMLTCMRLPSSLPRTFGTTPKKVEHVATGQQRIRPQRHPRQHLGWQVPQHPADGRQLWRLPRRGGGLPVDDRRPGCSRPTVEWARRGPGSTAVQLWRRVLVLCPEAQRRARGRGQARPNRGDRLCHWRAADRGVRHGLALLSLFWAGLLPLPATISGPDARAPRHTAVLVLWTATLAMLC